MKPTSSAIYGLALVLGLTVALFACKKETETDGPVTTPATSGLFGGAATMNVAGVVLDESGAPVQGATVMAGYGSQTTTTDSRGVFRLDSISGYTGLGLVRVSKSGYFPGSRSFLPAGALNVVRIVLLTRTQVGTVNGWTGGVVQSQGASVSFAGGGFEQNGAAYTGSVNVYMDRLDPGAADFAERMPGNLVAVQDNAPQMLLSYGMVAVELTDGAGQPVELAPGTMAEVRFPITDTQQGSAPAEIDLWWYDEDAGHWRHEGTATREGNEYVGQVSHFSFWNVDVPGDFVELRGDVYSNGGPVSGAIVTVMSQSMGSATDYTDPMGTFGGFVPAGEPLTLMVSLDCGNGNYQVVHTQQLGVLTLNTNVGLVVVANPNTTVVSGTVVGCNGQPLAQGYVLANGEPVFTNGGQFSFSICAGGSMTLLGIDPVGGGSSDNMTITLAAPTVNAGELEACGLGGGVPVLATVSASNITAIGAVCGGSISSDGGAPITARGVCWSTSPNPTTANSVTNNGSGTGSYTSNLTGLQPNTTYYVRAYATNAVTTAYGNMVQFTTVGVADGNGNVYSTVEIGGQVWMAENLRTTVYANGDPIQNVTNNTTWSQLNTGAWSYYNNTSQNNNIYGKLYNWYAVNDPRNVCPTGWHVPTDVEWQQLEQALGMPSGELNSTGDRGILQNVGGKMKSIGTQYWDAPNTGANNWSGFSALPGGYRGGSSGGLFFSLGNIGYWWSASGSGSDIATSRDLGNDDAGIGRYSLGKRYGIAVRCVRD
jgi:uncharacterized protein (TIGR02145 family)